jgi:hypothetical protein
MAVRNDLDGLRMQTPGDAPIYLIDQGQKRRIADPATYNGLFRDSWGIIYSSEVSELDDGPDVAAGTRLVQASGDSAIYLVDVALGVKRHIKDPGTMDRYYFGGGQVQSITLTQLAAYTDGSPIGWPESGS